MRASIFVTDDDPAVLLALSKRLRRRQHHVQGFDSGESLLHTLDEEIPDLILLDLKMPGLSGIEVLKRVRQKAPQSLVILLTAYGTIEDAVEAMKLGAYDFVIKNIDLSGVDPIVDRALEFLVLRQQVVVETENVKSRYAFANLIANSVSMKSLVGQIQELAQNPKTTVLLQGETGTGKEFIARILHHNSPRSESPFVGVNCSAIPKELLESELFGYERGAFTGAAQRKRGLIEQADGGTLFLDEIGDADLSMQAKLLRVLQERTIKRLGGKEDIEVDFRLIAATHHDLKMEVTQGLFREDLFFRLNVVALDLPPLRGRRADIVPLAMEALVTHSKEMGKNIVGIADETQEFLERYSYPGNIRELHNIIERAVIFSKSQTLVPGDLPQEVRERIHIPVIGVTKGSDQVLEVQMTLGKQTLAEIEWLLIEEVMRLCGSNKSRAAKKLGMTRFALDRRLKKKS